MEGNQGSYHEIAVPASVFITLRNELAKECGSLPTIHALHAAGYAAGTTAAAGFAAGTEGGAASMAEDTFWSRTEAFFARRGWGSLTHAQGSDAVGLLSSPDWMEATPAEVDEEGSCSFTSGYLSGFLSAVAGGPVAVLEVTCRTRGDDRCTFAFGSESAVHELYGQLLDGTDLEGAVAAL